jgi:hypothetical protein
MWGVARTSCTTNACVVQPVCRVCWKGPKIEKKDGLYFIPDNAFYPYETEFADMHAYVCKSCHNSHSSSHVCHASSNRNDELKEILKNHSHNMEDPDPVEVKLTRKERNGRPAETRVFKIRALGKHCKKEDMDNFNSLMKKFNRATVPYFPLKITEENLSTFYLVFATTNESESEEVCETIFFV